MKIAAMTHANATTDSAAFRHDVLSHRFAIRIVCSRSHAQGRFPPAFPLFCQPAPGR